MKLTLKKESIVAVILSILMLFSVSYADETTQEVEVDKALWNQAIMNVEAAETERMLAEWELLSLEEKYNILYKDNIEILMGYYMETLVLMDSLADPSGESISGSCYNLMVRIDATSIEVSNLIAESEYAYSKEFLTNSFNSLKTIVNHLDTCDLYIVTNDIESVEKVAGQVEEESEKFIEAFSKAYNYYMITQDGGLVTDSLNQTEDTFYKELTSNFNTLKSSYDKLQEAYGLIKKKKNGSDLIKEVKANSKTISFLNVKTLENKETMLKVSSAAKLLTEAAEELENYSFDIMTEGKGKDEKYTAKAKEIKVIIDEINTAYEAIGAEVNKVEKNVTKTVEEIEIEQLNEALENGYNSVEEYRAALKAQEELEYLEKIAIEYERLYEEKLQIEMEYQAMLEAIYQQWLYDRIDFSKGQLEQNHDKSFYMEWVKDDLADIYELDNYLGSIIYAKQSEAYDEMWNIANSQGADLELLQDLYDEYPSDFMTIVLLYHVESSF